MSGELTDVIFAPTEFGTGPQWVHVLKSADSSIYLNGHWMPPDVHPVIEGWLVQFRTLPAYGGGVWMEYSKPH